TTHFDEEFCEVKLESHHLQSGAFDYFCPLLILSERVDYKQATYLSNHLFLIESLLLKVIQQIMKHLLISNLLVDLSVRARQFHFQSHNEVDDYFLVGKINNF